jgi:hypothetical protein
VDAYEVDEVELEGVARPIKVYAVEARHVVASAPSV